MCLSPSIQEKQVIADTIFVSNTLFSFLMVYQFLKYDTNGMQITIKDSSSETQTEGLKLFVREENLMKKKKEMPF